MTPAPSVGGKLAIVEIVAIERHQRAAELAGQAVVLDVAGAAQIVMFDHREDIPPELVAHVADRAERHVGVGVDARPAGGLPDDRPELS